LRQALPAFIGFGNIGVAHQNDATDSQVNQFVDELHDPIEEETKKMEEK
jgi:hypothetical protein